MYLIIKYQKKFITLKIKNTDKSILNSIFNGSDKLSILIVVYVVNCLMD